MSYKKLQIWQLARTLTIDIHVMTLKLPSVEKYEEASQIRRSMKSVRSNIVEGYGRKRYKGEYIKYIVYALASNDESLDHLEILYETGSLKDKVLYEDLHVRIQKLGIKINNFLQVLVKDKD